ncbi:hypothetical protein B0H10DRAFT_2220156 [Mycena sp. CBHHK59/15]|nr:hypothetical protein B0H10DRAFT_2220156 [Mycena sp. CBHHK59/15]
MSDQCALDSSGQLKDASDIHFTTPNRTRRLFHLRPPVYPYGAEIGEKAMSLIAWINNHGTVRKIFDTVQEQLSKDRLERVVVLAYVVANLTRWTTHCIAFLRLLFLREYLQFAVLQSRGAIIAAQVGAAKSTEAERLKEEAIYFCDLISDAEFWSGLTSIVEDIEPICYGTNIYQKDSTRADQVLLTLAGLYLHYIDHPEPEISGGLVARLEKRWKDCDQPLFLVALILNPFEAVDDDSDVDELLDSATPGDPDATSIIESIEWTLDLTWALITAIEDDEEIKDGLFPGVGAIKLSGGKPKTHHYYNLAIKIFGEHTDYKTIFAVNPKLNHTQQSDRRKLWTNKCKNKVVKLVKKTRGQITEMGQTGAGIGGADEILPGTNLTTKWDVIKLESPWFFNVRSLIAERPNLQPVGLGSSDTAFDLTLLFPTRDDENSSAFGDTADLPDQLSEPGLPELDSDSDDDMPDASTLSHPKTGKRQREDDPMPASKSVPAAKKTKPQPATSTPAAPAAPAPVKKEYL